MFYFPTHRLQKAHINQELLTSFDGGYIQERGAQTAKLGTASRGCAGHLPLLTVDIEVTALGRRGGPHRYVSWSDSVPPGVTHSVLECAHSICAVLYEVPQYCNDV